jgi:hypothetical protein
VFVSTNGAASWTLVNAFTGRSVQALAFNELSGYAGTQTGGVYVRQLGSLYLPVIVR